MELFQVIICYPISNKTRPSQTSSHLYPESSSPSLSSASFLHQSRFLASAWKVMKVISPRGGSQRCETEPRHGQLNLPSALQRNVSRNMLGVRKQARTKWRSPLCPMGVTMGLALRIVTGLTNVFRGERGVSRMFGIAVARPTSAHHLLFNPLRAARCVRDPTVQL